MASISIDLLQSQPGNITRLLLRDLPASQRRESAELTFCSRGASAFVRDQSAARTAEIYQSRCSGPDERKSRRGAAQTYELGSKTLLDVIAEQRRFIETHTGYIEALINTYQARIEIERATASPNLCRKRMKHLTRIMKTVKPEYQTPLRRKSRALKR